MAALWPLDTVRTVSPECANVSFTMKRLSFPAQWSTCRAGKPKMNFAATMEFEDGAG
jgi:hypothetical protein